MLDRTEFKQNCNGHAFRRFSAVPRPFLRWAGSKQALIPSFLNKIPASFNRYFEPFLGSGALFFFLKPNRALLSDASAELIHTWKAVRDHVDPIIEYLTPLRPDKTLYYSIRENRSTNPILRAAEFLYLNKTCWNGLYRVNSKGKFNVPYGLPKTEFLFDEENLRACSTLLQEYQIRLRISDFADNLIEAKRGDFVYLDPPYVTKHNNNGFKDWNERLFSWDDQLRLANIATSLRRKGVKVMISNANHRDVIALYPDFQVSEFQRSSTLSSAAQFRGFVGEVVLTANI